MREGLLRRVESAGARILALGGELERLDEDRRSAETALRDAYEERARILSRASRHDAARKAATEATSRRTQDARKEADAADALERELRKARAEAEEIRQACMGLEDEAERLLRRLIVSARSLEDQALATFARREMTDLEAERP